MTPTTLTFSLAATAGLFLAKMSAPFIVPIGLILAAARVGRATPWEVRLPHLRHTLATRGRQIGLLVGLIGLHVVATYVAIWAAHDFRYSAFAPRDDGATIAADNDHLSPPWETIFTPNQNQPRHKVFDVIQAIRERQLLPEAYLFGYGHVAKFAGGRRMFVAGRYGREPWWWFFPYAVLIKSPLPMFATLAVAVAAAFAMRRRASTDNKTNAAEAPAPWWYRTLPLWTLLGVYWTVAVCSAMNIGIRHVLPTFPPMFILAGAAGWFLADFGASTRREPAWIVGLLLVWSLVDATLAFPDYLPYFNGLVGGPRHGYRQLVDSSLDWGQDLKRLSQKLAERSPSEVAGRPTLVAYWGHTPVDYYGLTCELLPCYPTDFQRPVDVTTVTPRGGTYCISANFVSGVILEFPGPWCEAFERIYQNYRSLIAALNGAADDAERRRILEQVGAEEVERFRIAMPHLQLARLCAYLRQREPDDFAGPSILIYDLSDADVRQALEGPPAELIAEPAY